VPNDQIYKFEGSYTLHNQKKKVSLSSENLLLRGSSLRNTEWAIGFVVYAGHQTKIMMNSANSKYKMSTIEKGTNRQIILIFFVQLLMCLFCSVFGAIWQHNLADPAYLDFKDSWDTKIGFIVLRMTGTWVLIFTYHNNIVNMAIATSCRSRSF